MHIKREIIESIKTELDRQQSKIIVIYGARQVGKTTLVENVLADNRDQKILRINGDRIGNNTFISSRDLQKLESLVFGYDILFIDEAQRIPEIGINLKILYDNIKNLKIIVTGSSSLDLASSIKEPITGRKKQYTLHPISFLELSKIYNKYELSQIIEERLIFGSYPEIFTIKNRVEKAKYITELTEDYLYKDVLELENIRYHHKLRDLLRLLAFQIGSEVSLNELSNNLGLSKDTIARYIDLLEQSFVIFRLRGFSRNLRKEVNKKPKIYFYDLGIRNSLIDNFNDIDKRNDIGALWENFLIVERLKRNGYQSHLCSQYFWRTYTGAELDYIEEYGGKLFGYEFKWKKESKAPQSWLATYNGSFQCLNKENFVDFIL